LIDGNDAVFDLNQRKAAVKDVLSYIIDHAPLRRGRRASTGACRATLARTPGGVGYEQEWFSA